MLKLIKNKLGRSTALTVSLSLILLLAVGGTVAFLIDFAGPVVNTFTPSDVEITVDEKFEDNIKSSIKIENSGTTDVYIRVAVIANWCNSADEIVKPWSGTLSIDGGWVQGSDGYYYWLTPVSPGNKTGEFLGSSVSGGVDGDLHLEMTVLSQAIQADGVDSNNEYPVVKAWESVTGVNTDGTLKVSTPSN